MKSALLKATALSVGVAASLTLVDLQPASAAGFGGLTWSLENLDLNRSTGDITPGFPSGFTDGCVSSDATGNTCAPLGPNPSSITLIGGNFFGDSPVDANGDGSPGVTGATYYLTTLAASSLPSYVSFTWNYGTFDLPVFDADGNAFGVDPFVVVDPSSPDPILLAEFDGESGIYTFLVNPGEQFGFGVLTEDNAFGSGYATISNFSVTPVPTPALLPGLIGMGVAALRKKRSEAEESEA
jgi:hypothetical protein